jgi:ABC-type siderophore export system fused ATPase/permease subunit
MTLWVGVLLASALVYSWKLLGHLVPERFVKNPSIRSLAALLTVAMLAGLVGVQTFVSAEGVSLDARAAALAVAAVLFYLRVPFNFVVIAAAAVASLLRMWL